MSPPRIQMLGPMRVLDAYGNPVSVSGGSTDGVMSPCAERQLLAVLALKAGTPCTLGMLTEASHGYESWESKLIQAPMARLRTQWGLAEFIPHKSRGVDTYRVDIPRAEVDALSFIDLASRPAEGAGALDAALGLWRGDPVAEYGLPHASLWEELRRAVSQVLLHIEGMSTAERSSLLNLPTFERHSVSLRERQAPAPKRAALLLVEDDQHIVQTVRDVLFDYEIVVAETFKEAVSAIGNPQLELHGAIVDRHLSAGSLDGRGLQVLAQLRDTPTGDRPPIPRLLLTSDVPEGSTSALIQTYGLVDVVMKGGQGQSAPGLREAVEEMLENVIARAHAQASETEAYVARSLLRKRSSLRREARQVGRDGSALEAELEDLEERFTAELESLIRQLGEEGSNPEARAHQFSVRWRKKVDDVGGGEEGSDA